MRTDRMSVRFVSRLFRMISKYLLITMMFFPSAVCAGIPFIHGNLKVDDSGRYLEYDDGTPFLYMGDTAWEMLSRLTYEEACVYMDNRVGKGINVIQTVLLSELVGVRDTTAVGVPQLIDGDVLRPNPRYLAHVDSVIAYAEHIGLYLAILPTWGDKVDKQWGIGPEVFDEHNAETYGKLLGNRWASCPNIIWVIGGDRGGDGKNRAIWNAMARGIKSVDKIHLMTYHPHGEHSSSMWFHNEKWLDFNMIQTGHCQNRYDIYRRMMLNDMSLRPVKPVMDGEPRYEDIPRNFKLEDGRFAAIDVRRTLYQSMLTGACGYTYGNNNLWQMYAPGRESKCGAQTYWYNAMDMEAECQLIHFVRLWNEIPFSGGYNVPDCAVPVDDYNTDEAVAFITGDYLLCYFPGGSRWKLTIPDTFGLRYTIEWMNPRTGQRMDRGISEGYAFDVCLPEHGNDDWLLIFKKEK